ncbi:HPP family protein [Synechococcus sp. 1G10]|uniref:HPP family protein n=1 Tax=Synechococcus sp. 1G10 TaxID=2025605 RepID=UPI0021014C99|nr:HPP family protein [Synechococcus sp. 1G10]
MPTTLFEPTWWAIATGTVHQPAGSSPVIVFLVQPGWNFLLLPTLLGSLVVTLVALLYNNTVNTSHYPKYW